MTWLFACFDISWVVYGGSRRVPCSTRDAMEVAKGARHKLTTFCGEAMAMTFKKSS